MERPFQDQLDFADTKILQALETVKAQKLRVFDAELRRGSVNDAGNSLSELEKELQQWRDYRTLLLIRINMISPQASD